MTIEEVMDPGNKRFQDPKRAQEEALRQEAHGPGYAAIARTATRKAKAVASPDPLDLIPPRACRRRARSPPRPRSSMRRPPMPPWAKGLRQNRDEPEYEFAQRVRRAFFGYEDHEEDGLLSEDDSEVLVAFAHGLRRSCVSEEVERHLQRYGAEGKPTLMGLLAVAAGRRAIDDLALKSQCGHCGNTFSPAPNQLPSDGSDTDD